MSTTPPLALTKATIPGALGVIGPAETLQSAYDTNQPVTLGHGKCAGEIVYLGHARQTFDLDADGVCVERVGLDRFLGETPNFPGVQVAVYLVDLTRLEQAPTIAALTAKAEEIHTASAARVAAEDERLENDSEDGA